MARKMDMNAKTQNASERSIAGLEIIKVVREFVPIVGGGDLSFGQIIDMTLQEAAMNHQEVQELKFTIESDSWHEFAHKVHESGAQSAYGED